jgi:hypothetical protein
VSAPTLRVKAKGDKNLDNQAKTNSLFVVRVTLNLRITLDQGHRPLKLNARNDALRYRCTLVRFEPRVEPSPTCRDFFN